MKWNLTKCRWGSVDKEDFTEKVTFEANTKGEGGTGHFRQTEESKYRGKQYMVYSPTASISKPMHRHRRKSWQEIRLERKTGISSEAPRHQAAKFGFYF